MAMASTLDADDVLNQLVHFLGTTESRNKVYRLIQYGAKMSKWVVMTKWELRNDELEQEPFQAAAFPSKQQKQLHASAHFTDAVEPTEKANQKNQQQLHSSSAATETPTRKQARYIARMLARIESLFGDARKVYRFFQFLEMMDLFRHVNDADPAVRLLRRLRVMCFFFFYLLENYMVFLLRVEGFPHRHPRVVLLKRSCNGFWCISILLAFALDHVTKRSGVLSSIKKLLDLPVAYLAFTDSRVSDGLFGTLGIASAQVGVYLRWIEVMAKMQQKRLVSSRTAKLVITDLA